MCRILRSGERAVVVLSASALLEGPVLFRSCTTSIRKSRDRSLAFEPTRRKLAINTNYKIALAVLAGAAIGAAATQGLHAQAKLKAYSVAEVETLDAAGQASYIPAVRKEIASSHGRSLLTIGGRVVPIEGPPSPQHLALVEWDSVDDVVAFYNSNAWTDFAPQRDKAQKTIRRYVVEVEN